MTTPRSLAAAAILALASAAPAAAATFLFNPGGGDGSATIFASSDAGVAFTMTGSDSGTLSEIDTTLLATETVPLSVTFSFAYISSDRNPGGAEGPFWDQFGFLIDGVRYLLSDNEGPSFQFGTRNFLVPAGAAFGWYILSLDDRFGPATVQVAANFTKIDPPAVALPAGGVLVLTALGALLLVARRRTV